MKTNNHSVLTPFYKTIDKVIFGIQDVEEIEEQPYIREWIIEEDQEDRVVIRSVN